MGISKPYYRIIRPFSKDPVFSYCNDWNDCFLSDIRYAEDRAELWRAYKLIEKDLLKLFEYVEPTDNNIQTYSHRTYELLLRAATEFETNCKRILESNGYTRSGNLNITDYFRINAASKLGDYSTSLTAWYPEKKKLKPFDEWASGQHSLSWYKSYNKVKHDRNRNFHCASLENVLNAIGALFIVLFSQFFVFVANPGDLLATSDGGQVPSRLGDIFEVVAPTTWTDDELYDFDWKSIKDDPQPFAKFPF